MLFHYLTANVVVANVTATFYFFLKGDCIMTNIEKLYQSIENEKQRME